MKNLKKTASLLLGAVIVFNLIPVFPVMADEAVSISTVADFKEFTEKCVYDEYSKNKKFVLQNDIDLKGEEIQCAEIFCGTFEGGGHSITNVKLSFEGSDKGLFATLTKDGQIHDLNVTGTIKVTDKADNSTESILRRRATSILSRVNISSDNIDDSAKAAGGIVGYNAGKIVNCSFDGSITGKRQVGGIAGFNSMTGIIDSCSNGAEVDGEKEAGGIAGYNEGRVKLSKNTGKICPEADEKTTDIGGITGNSEGAVVICTNEGTVGGESFGDNVGGISGKQSGEIRECVNNGFVQGRRSVGGICGRFEPYTDIELSYESAKAAVDKQIDIWDEDVENARKRIVDLVDELTDGKGILSDVLERLGIKEGSTGSRLDRLTDSSIGMMDSITNAVGRASDRNLAGSIKDTLDSLNNFSNEATATIKDTGDSLDKTLASVDDFLAEFDGKGQEITDTLNNLNEAIDNGESDVDEIKDRLFTQLDNLEEDLDDLDTNLNETHRNLQQTMRALRNAGVDVGSFFDDVDTSVTNTQDEVQRIRNNIEKTKKEVNDRISNIRSRIVQTPAPTAEGGDNTGYKVNEDEQLYNGYEVEPKVVGSLKSLLFTTAYAAGDDGKLSISDLKSTDISLPRLIGDENADTALIKYCINNAGVKGNEMAGGISGSTGFESAVRSGDSITLPDGTKVDSDAVLKALTDSCISYGDITSKADYAGGISGKCDIGDIKNSLTTGEITSEEGGYAGGIAGYSSGEIVNCIAINDVDGESYIGGIAGSGKFINTSYSLARLDGKKDKAGAIAGFVSGEVNGTYFIDEGLSGVNGTNYEGRAEAVAPEDIAVSDGQFPEKMPLLNTDDFYMAADDLYMPQIKTLAQPDAEQIGALLQSKSYEMARFRFNVVFIDKGKELRAATVEYGTVLTDSDIPRLRADGSEVPAWDKDVHAPIVRHTKFIAEYNKATMTIASNEEPPLLLVESVFDDGTTLSLREEDVDRDFYGYKKGEAYSFTLSKNAYDVLRVHVRDPRKKAAKIAVQENGKWTLLDCKADGSYAVFEVGAPCKFVILYSRTSQIIFIIAALAALLAAAAGFVIFRRIRKHGREEKKDV